MLGIDIVMTSYQQKLMLENRRALKNNTLHAGHIKNNG